ncbi:hypothetical protein FB451DRAFT_374951 [Mycena latifolia]|nr:hypothetical protein FB451DRAFT_374951 [Mycena latifolia]
MNASYARPSFSVLLTLRILISPLVHAIYSLAISRRRTTYDLHDRRRLADHVCFTLHLSISPRRASHSRFYTPSAPTVLLFSLSVVAPPTRMYQLLVPVPTAYSIHPLIIFIVHPYE